MTGWREEWERRRQRLSQAGWIQHGREWSAGGTEEWEPPHNPDLRLSLREAWKRLLDKERF